MGLFDKHNPQATRRSAIIAAVIGAIIGGLFAIVMLWSRSDLSSRGFVTFVPLIAIGGAIAGWAVDWQVPPDEDI